MDTNRHPSTLLHKVITELIGICLWRGVLEGVVEEIGEGRKGVAGGRGGFAELRPPKGSRN
jgi:hypothetical protein